MSSRLIVAVGLTTAAAAVAHAAHPLPMVLAVPAGLLMVFVVPGCSLRRALGLAGGDGLTEAVLSVATSVGVVLGVGLLLNLLPVGLTRASWSTALAVIVALTSVVVLRREGLEKRTERWTPRYTSPDLGTAVRIAALVALVVAVGALAIQSQQGLNRRSSFAELSVSPSAPRLVTVHSHEASATTYRLVVTVRGDRKTFMMRLEPGGVWSRRLDEVVLVGQKGRFSIDLFRPDDSVPYRHVSSTLGAGQ